MAAPWEKYASNSNPPQSDDSGPWAKYSSQMTPDNSQQYTPGQSAVIGGEQGLLLGARPLVAGVGGGAGNAYAKYEQNRREGKGYLDSLDQTGEAFKQGFEENRKGAIQEQGDAASQNPKSYYGAEIAGGIPSGMLIPGKGLGAAMRTGAGTAGIHAAANAESPIDTAKDVGMGVGTGALAYGAAQAVSKGIQSLSNATPGIKNFATNIVNKLSQPAEEDINPNAEIATQLQSGPLSKQAQDLPEGYLAKKAGLKAYKSMGPYAKDIRGQDLDQVAKQGQILMKEGVVGGAPTSYEGLANRANDALEGKGEEFEQALGQISDAADQMAQKMGPGATAGVSKTAILQKLKTELTPNPNIPTLKNTNKQMGELFNQVSQGPNFMSIRDAQGLKTELGQMLDRQGVWRSLKMGNQVNPEQQFQVAYYHALNKGVEDTADAVAPQLGPDALKNWQNIKQDYGALKAAAAMANNRSGREFVNRFISPSDYFSSAMGMGLSHNPAGLALGILNHYGRTRGNQIAAQGLNALSKTNFSAPAGAPQALTTGLTNAGVNR